MFKQLETDGFKLWLKPLNPCYAVIEPNDEAKYCGTAVQAYFNEKLHGAR